MHKITAVLLSLMLLAPGLARSNVDSKLELELICGGTALLLELTRRWGEQPMLMGDAQVRQDDQNHPGVMILYVNPKTGTYTVMLKIQERYCVMTAGQQLIPVQPNRL